jgi:hypothetical protein
MAYDRTEACKCILVQESNGGVEMQAVQVA